MIKLGIVGYVQKPEFGCATTFLEHIRSVPTKFPLILYSYHDYPGLVKLKMDPESPVLKLAKNQDGSSKSYAISNAAFFAGMRIARAAGLTHVIYLETDCRVGEASWDETMFAEYFGMGRPLVCAGTLACFNAANSGLEAAKRWKELVTTSGKNVPVAAYGWKGADMPFPSNVFPNGALAIYDVAWIFQLFGTGHPNIEGGSVELATHIGPFDMEVGVRLWDLFGVRSYDMVGYLESIYSGFGDVLTTQQFRQDLLTSGKVVAIHQIKDGWVP